MLLTIDAGNTNVSCGVFDGDNLVTKFRFITALDKTPDEFELYLHSILQVRKIDPSRITEAIISSVVPNLNEILISAIEDSFHIKPLLIEPGVKTGLTILIDDPKSCGSDLIVDCVAAYDKYHDDCLIVDFGTATKFLYVSKKCEFQYGIIAPGLQITANSLWQKTAQLPAVALKKPASILTKNTVSCMQAGIMYGYIGLTKEIIRQIREEIGHDFKVIATGGLARNLITELDEFDDYDVNLAHKGMKIIYNKNVRGE